MSRREHAFGRPRRDRGVATRIGAEVPHNRGAGPFDQLRNGGILARCRSLIVGGGDAVLGPFGATRLPVEPLDDTHEAVEQGSLTRWADGLLLRLGASLGTARVASLCPGMQMNVAAQPKVETRPAGEQRGGEIDRHPVRVIAQQGPQPNVAARHQCQGREKMLAELSVCSPRRPGASAPERQGVDQDGPRPQELHVVRTGVPELEVVGRCLALGPERQVRGGLELAERPLVGVGDERDRPRLDDRERGRLLCRPPKWCQLVLDEQTVPLHAVEQATLM